MKELLIGTGLILFGLATIPVLDKDITVAIFFTLVGISTIAMAIKGEKLSDYEV